jgi:NAD(P)-dependent dehydrogenase (short-subunit alcohol dehydrogenase family)
MTLDGSTAIVTGASRGFGKAIAATLTDAGAKVIGLARNPADGVQVGDAADPALAERLIREHRPRILVLNAGALPVNRPLPEQTWDTFSRHWEGDVRPAFEWTRAALRAPLPPDSRVVVLSSGAAVKGSPASGGYAGAKATVRFIAAYAAAESERAGLGIGFASLLPALTPAGGVGASGAEAYAARQGTDVASFLAAMGPTLTAEQVGAAVLDLVTTDRPPGAWLLGPHGLTPA